MCARITISEKRDRPIILGREHSTQEFARVQCCSLVCSSKMRLVFVWSRAEGCIVKQTLPSPTVAHTQSEGTHIQSVSGGMERRHLTACLPPTRNPCFHGHTPTINLEQCRQASQTKLEFAQSATQKCVPHSMHAIAALRMAKVTEISPTPRAFQPKHEVGPKCESFATRRNTTSTLGSVHEVSMAVDAVI